MRDSENRHTEAGFVRSVSVDDPLEPPRDRIAATAVFIPNQTPFWLILTIESHSSSLVSSSPDILKMPALLTRTSSPPNVLMHASTAACQSAARVTSR